MNPEYLQVLLYGGFLALGWLLRHRGIPFPVSPLPAPEPAPVVNPSTPSWVQELLPVLLQILKQLTQSPSSVPGPAAMTPPTQAATLHVPVAVQIGQGQPQV